MQQLQLSLTCQGVNFMEQCTDSRLVCNKQQPADESADCKHCRLNCQLVASSRLTTHISSARVLTVFVGVASVARDVLDRLRAEISTACTVDGILQQKVDKVVTGTKPLANLQSLPLHGMFL